MVSLFSESTLSEIVVGKYRYSGRMMINNFCYAHENPFKLSFDCYFGFILPIKIMRFNSRRS